MSRHMLLMIVCCAVPLALILALPYLGVSLSSSGWLLLVLLLCPLLHLFLMRGHGHAEKKGHHHPKE